ncbi:MAG: hypothetical protein HY940_03560 [Gammaproteobacteria bacterium]|nr:hypothetical protein [Gammaproteobacteria bacterium]
MFKSMRAVTMMAALLATQAWSPAQAAVSDILLQFQNTEQAAFNSFIDDLGMIVAYNPVAPAEPYGITGFDIGIALSSVEVDATVWQGAMAGVPSSIPVPKLMVRKGLPLGIDVGIEYTQVPGSNITITGGELRYALLDGSTTLPAVSLSGQMSNLSGVDDVDVSTYGLDLAVSKGIAMLTPYAGIGQVWVDGKDNRAGGLADHSASLTRYYAGAKFSFLPFMNMVAQADMGAVQGYSVRLNVGF